MKEIAILVIIFILLPFAGCKKEQPVMRKPMAEQVKPEEVTKETKEAEPAGKPGEEQYAYDMGGRRDPFLPLIVIAKQQKATKKKGASPFESYDISEINLLAIAWDKNKYYALIRLPDRKTYTITEGMTLGMQGGKVEKITNNSVTIKEYIKDVRGNIKPKETILKLHKGEEE